MDQTFLADFTKKDSTKNQIINVLGYDWPLSIRRIYFILKKRHGLKITYQAVYKAMNQMLSENILSRSKEGYQLNLKWVKEIHDQTEIIRVNYFSEKQAAIFDKEEGDSEAIRVFIFKNWFDVEKYLYYIQKNHILNSKQKQDICVHHAHDWRPLFYLRAEYNWVRQLKRLGHRVFILCSGDSSVDRWAARFYRKIGCNMKLNEKCAETAEVMVFSDLVIQTYIPLELRQALEREFERIKSPEEIDYDLLIKKIFEKECEIKVIVNKDRVLASQIRNQTLKRFNRD